MVRRKKKKFFVKKLIWDDWNIAHIAKHKINPAEVEEVLKNDPVKRKGHEDRLFMIGKTNTVRMLAVILDRTDEEDVYYPRTSYEASQTSIRDYNEEKKRKGGEKIV